MADMAAATKDKCRTRANLKAIKEAKKSTASRDARHMHTKANMKWRCECTTNYASHTETISVIQIEQEREVERQDFEVR